jgi:predicted NUDIX family phosphoesterase
MSKVVKKPEFILGAKAAAFTNIGLTQGLKTCNIATLIPLIQKDLVIGQRNELETDESVRQLLPYTTFVKNDAAGLKLFAYRRGNGVGESRLLGNVSVGLGGHIDLADVVHRGSVIDLDATVGQAIGRELQEEVVISGGNELSVVSIGTIIDDTNAVGRVHAGLFSMVMVAPETMIECREEELEAIGFMGAQELLDSGLPLENWTKIICEWVVESGL